MAEFEIGGEDFDAEASADDGDFAEMFPEAPAAVEGTAGSLTVETAEPLSPDGDESEVAESMEASGEPEATGEGADGQNAGEETLASNESEAVTVTGLTAPKTTLTLGVMEKAPLNISALPEGAECTLKYVVSDKKNVSVTADGVVSCKKQAASPSGRRMARATS